MAYTRIVKLVAPGNGESGVVLASSEHYTEILAAANYADLLPPPEMVAADYVYGLAGELTGTFQGGIAVEDIVSADYVIVGHDNYTGGEPGTYPTSETSKAEQLAEDAAALDADKILLDQVLLTGAAPGTIRMPTVARVEKGFAFGPGDSLIGELEPKPDPDARYYLDDQNYAHTWAGNWEFCTRFYLNGWGEVAGFERLVNVTHLVWDGASAVTSTGDLILRHFVEQGHSNGTCLLPFVPISYPRELLDDPDYVLLFLYAGVYNNRAYWGETSLTLLWNGSNWIITDSPPGPGNDAYWIGSDTLTPNGHYVDQIGSNDLDIVGDGYDDGSGEVWWHQTGAVAMQRLIERGWAVAVMGSW